MKYLAAAILACVTFFAAIGFTTAIQYTVLPVFAAEADAKEADPVVVPCKKINEAKVSDTLTIAIFRCNPENGSPYNVNTAGFMMPVDQ